VLVRFTVYCLRDGERAGSTTQDRGGGPDAGRLLIRRQVTRLPSRAEVAEIESLCDDYQKPGISKEQREEIKEAAAQYVASWMEGQLGTTWWETQDSFPLSRAADLLDGFAEWLSGLAEHPLADIASAAGALVPIVPIVAGISANFVTASVTAPLEAAALICEIAGIFIGLATGAFPLVIAGAKLLAHDMGRGALEKVVEREIFDSPSADSKPSTDIPLRHDADKQTSADEEFEKELQQDLDDGKLYGARTIKHPGYGPQHDIGLKKPGPHPGIGPSGP
jgi:hypothetical protein